VNWRVVSPREAALQILAARFGGATPEMPTSLPLAEFQREAVRRATAILRERGGVLIADSVGLGKTFVALAMIEAALARDERVLVVVPASLRRMWQAELRRLPVVAPADCLHLASHTQLAYGAGAGRSNELVVVDEAHAFRNGRTRRYRALRAACRGARVVLLTATPVNNSLSDLYFQLRLFCADGAFRDLGIGSLGELLRPHRTAGVRDLERLRCAVMVRRTRAELRRDDQSVFHFPRHVVIRAVPYALPLPTAQLADFLGRLTFVGYRLDPRLKFSADVLRCAFLKRMESSVHAMRMTLQRQIRFYEQLIAALERDVLLRPAVFRSLYDLDDASLQLVIEDIALDPTPFPVSLEHRDCAQRELETLRQWDALLRSAHDDKADKLRALLNERPSGAKTIVFSEFRDTARHLWRLLRRCLAVALIDGAGAWIGETQAARRQVIERFAPVANGGRAVHPREAVSVLIATDVLAEGMNLQDADAVVSYDLPWNPIRLIQRAGRVDRIASPHDVVYVHNFIPDREFDAFLGLARTIRNKLETVRASVGLERSLLDPEEDFESVSRALAIGDSGILERLEPREDNLRTGFERFRPVRATGEVEIAKMPGASGERMVVGLARRTEWIITAVNVATGSTAVGSEATLAAALRETSVGEIDVQRYERAAAAYAEQIENETRAARMDKLSSPAKVARLIRHHLAELPFDEASGRVYAFADEVMERLASVVDANVEEELDVLTRRPWPAIGELLSAAKEALANGRKTAFSRGNWLIVGVIVAD
jgi:superfamily II DNA or RNA helicase